MYVVYCQNKPVSEYLVSDHNDYFEVTFFLNKLTYFCKLEKYVDYIRVQSFLLSWPSHFHFRSSRHKLYMGSLDIIVTAVGLSAAVVFKTHFLFKNN